MEGTNEKEGQKVIDRGIEKADRVRKRHSFNKFVCVLANAVGKTDAVGTKPNFEDAHSKEKTEYGHETKKPVSFYGGYCWKWACEFVFLMKATDVVTFFQGVSTHHFPESYLMDSGVFRIS